jgi:hypothetical protein
MAKVNTLLSQRLKNATKKLSKMTNLAELSSSGNLSSFAGIFRVSPLSNKEQEALRSILTAFCHDEQDIHEDLTSLISITSEVKAINNQAIILHGERVKKAQEILKGYREGAFTAWLIATYGNRQTPYNFLQYYELHVSLPQPLHQKLDEMPRQAVYALASREGDFEQKIEIIRNYAGEPKQELLSLIRKTFPLSTEDKRKQDLAQYAINQLWRLENLLKSQSFISSPKQKKRLKEILSSLERLIETSS